MTKLANASSARRVLHVKLELIFQTQKNNIDRRENVAKIILKHIKEGLRRTRKLRQTERKIFVYANWPWLQIKRTGPSS